MFCPVCGKQISDHAKFCPFCGTTMQPSQEAPQPNPYSQPTYQEPYSQAPQAPQQPMYYQQPPYQQAQQTQQAPYQEPYPQQPYYNQTYQTPISPETPSGKKSSSNKGLLIALCSILGLLLVGVILLIVIMLSRSNSPKRPTSSGTDVTAPADPSKDSSDASHDADSDQTENDPITKPDGQNGSNISGNTSVPNDADAQQAPNYPVVTVSGQLKEKNTGKPLVDVVLVLLNDDEALADYHYAATDNSGAYTFEEVPIGSYTLLLDNDAYPYFEPFTITVTGEQETLTVEAVEIEVPADYYAYLKEYLIPAYGLSDLSAHTKTVTAANYQQDIFWDDRTGIVSADLVDLNVDGITEMVVYRFAQYTSEYYTTPVLGLYAEVYTQTEEGVIYGTEPVLLMDCVSSDSNEYRCCLVPQMYGYFIMVQCIYHPEGAQRVFTGGLPSAPSFYSFDGVKLFRDIAISADTAGDMPFHTTLADGSKLDFKTLEEAIQSCGIALDSTPLEGDYYYGNFAFFTSLVYRVDAIGDGSSANVATTLDDLTYLRPELEMH